MSKFLKCAVAAAAAMGVHSMAAAEVAIDPFTQVQTIADVTTGDGGAWAPQVCGAGIFLGCRDIYVEKASQSTTDGALGVRAAAVAGKFNFSEDTDQVGLAAIRWDGAAANTGSALGTTNIAGVGESLLALGNGVNVTYSSDFAFNIAICVYTTLTDFSCAGQVTTATGVLNTVTQQILWSEFVQFGTGAANFADIHAIEVIFNGDLAQASVDLSFSTTKIPEPATLALTGLALLGAAGAARRRRQG